jgi:succinoglycan biosynthesis protein ExoW
MPKFNIIIPFYQRERGILPVAVESALAQEGDEMLVTVIDDGSPVPAREELASIMARDFRVLVVEQANSGPGAARNRGLEETPNNVDYVAFLDSDDRWLPGHLKNASIAMGHGADFYFADADHHERGMSASRFMEAGFDTSLSERIEEGSELFFYRGALFDAILGSSPVGTSTVVFRRSMGGKLRFPEGLIFGEDKFLWMRLALVAGSVAFSTRCEAIYGRGINIYAAATWGTPEALKRLFHTAKVHRLIGKSFQLTGDQELWNVEWLGEVRRTFAGNLLHLLHHGKPVDWRVVMSYARMDPRLARDIAITFGKGVLRVASLKAK